MTNRPLSSVPIRACVRRSHAAAALMCLLLPMFLRAQTAPEMAQVLDRLARLEESNRELVAEVRALRAELASSRQPQPSQAKDEERLSVIENRVDEQAQVKVEASQRFPIRLTGMALFNTFLNSKGSGGERYPTVAEPAYESSAGATFRQSMIGLDYRGPQTVWGGKVRGALLLDLYGGSGRLLDQLLRLRTAYIAVDWKSRGILAGLDKPIISPREPNSLAQAGVSPLTGAGNLWLWIPQVRLEQNFRFGETSGVRAQIGVVQTPELYPTTAPGNAAEVQRARPGLEGRVEFHAGDQRRIEIAPGFHTSTSHAIGFSVPSNLVSLDWLVRPLSAVDFSGEFFSGQNVASLGTGGAGGGFTLFGPARVAPVHSRGGWGQVTYRATRRLSFNLFSGQQDNRNRDLPAGQIGRNLAYGANLAYRLAPNVILGVEASQLRTTRISAPTALNNHYDLALAYIF